MQPLPSRAFGTLVALLLGLVSIQLWRESGGALASAAAKQTVCLAPFVFCFFVLIPHPKIAESIASAFISPANAEMLAEALCRMRGAALKLGQMISIQGEHSRRYRLLFSDYLPFQMSLLCQRQSPMLWLAFAAEPTSCPLLR